MVAELAPDLKRGLSTGLDVLIVGGGLGGLFAAVEMCRQGHNVRVVEGKTGIEGLGESVLSLQLKSSKARPLLTTFTR